MLRRLPVRCRSHDESMQILHLPSIPDKTICEPVQQFWMRWWPAERAEIARILHQPPSKMSLPDAVHNHAGRERVIGLREPFGESRASSGCFLIRDWQFNRRVIRINHAQKTRRDFCHPSGNDRRRSTVANIRHDQRGGECCRFGFIIFCQFPAQCKQPILVVAFNLFVPSIVFVVHLIGLHPARV